MIPRSTRRAAERKAAQQLTPAKHLAEPELLIQDPTTDAAPYDQLLRDYQKRTPARRPPGIRSRPNPSRNHLAHPPSPRPRTPSSPKPAPNSAFSRPKAKSASAKPQKPVPHQNLRSNPPDQLASYFQNAEIDSYLNQRSTAAALSPQRPSPKTNAKAA
jgi:hypothetical protein